MNFVLASATASFAAAMFAQSTPPTNPAKLAATVGSRTTGQVRDFGLEAPSS